MKRTKIYSIFISINAILLLFLNKEFESSRMTSDICTSTDKNRDESKMGSTSEEKLVCATTGTRKNNIEIHKTNSELKGTCTLYFIQRTMYQFDVNDFQNIRSDIVSESHVNRVLHKAIFFTLYIYIYIHVTR